MIINKFYEAETKTKTGEIRMCRTFYSQRLSYRDSCSTVWTTETNGYRTENVTNETLFLFSLNTRPSLFTNRHSKWQSD